jgi:hypothetical protein
VDNRVKTVGKMGGYPHPLFGPLWPLDPCLRRDDFLGAGDDFLAAGMTLSQG